MVVDRSEGEAPPLSRGAQAMPQEGSSMLPICSQGPSWMDDIRGFLKKNIVPKDDATTERIARQSKRYITVDGNLYQRGTDGVLLRCISWEEGGELLAEVHKGECGSHSSSRTLVGKAFRQGFY